MSSLLKKIVRLINEGEILISAHGYDELAEDKIKLNDIIWSVSSAEIIQEYPDYKKGPCILVLQYDNGNQPIHVVWGIPLNQETPAVLVTAYRPDPKIWKGDLKQGKQHEQKNSQKINS